MTASYSGRWAWPVQECTHPAERRVQVARRYDDQGQLVHQIPEYCRDCGMTFTPPAEESA